MTFIYNELFINLSVLIDRLRTSWKSRRWISDREYYEIRRGN
jgi:hypothetical protein